MDRAIFCKRVAWLLFPYRPGTDADAKQELLAVHKQCEVMLA